MTEQARRVAALAAGPERPSDPLRVLVAERDDWTRIAVATVLEAAGMVVVACCADGATAISTVTRRPVDVCLIGLDLAGGGVTTVRAISALSRPPRILARALTARECDALAALRAGADSVFVLEIDATGLPPLVSAVAAGDVVLPRGVTARLVDEFRQRARGGPGSETA